MRKTLSLAIVLAGLAAVPAAAGDAEISAAQSTIDQQLQAFLADDEAAAYSLAAPSIKRMFPSVESFMAMVEGGYMPVRRPQSYAFGKTHELSPTSIIQQVLLVGPDGKNYEAVYTLALQEDGVFRITGCSLRASSALNT